MRSGGLPMPGLPGPAGVGEWGMGWGELPGPCVVRGESSSCFQARTAREGRLDAPLPLGPAWQQRGLCAQGPARLPLPEPWSAQSPCEARTPNVQSCLYS